MIIFAIHLIRNDGRHLVSEYFQSDSSVMNDKFLGCLMLSLKGLALEFLQREMKTLNFDTISYHIHTFGLFHVILATELDQNPDPVIQEIGFRFIQMYGESLLKRDIRTNKFSSFRQIMREIVSNYSDITHSINPTKLLGTEDIYSMPIELQSLALLMLSVGEATYEQIKNEDEFTPDLDSKLDRLLQLGYLGRKVINKKQIYFCSK